MRHFYSGFAFLWVVLPVLATVAGCSAVPQTHSFLMPDGRKAAIVSVAGNGVTPPAVAFITPKRSPYDVRIVSATPPLQSALQGAVGGIAIGAGLAAQGALIRPSRLSSSANNIGGSATGGSASGGSATGGTVINCVGVACP
jgi:hypothetical protein